MTVYSHSVPNAERKKIVLTSPHPAERTLSPKLVSIERDTRCKTIASTHFMGFLLLFSGGHSKLLLHIIGVTPPGVAVVHSAERSLSDEYCDE